MRKTSKEASILRFFHEATKIHQLGSSSAIIIPPAWIRLYSTKVNGTRYAKVTTDGNRIIIEPITEDSETIKANLERNGVKQVEIS